MPEVELPNPEHLEHQGSKSFSRRVALTTAFYAVVLAVAALGSKVAMKEMLLAQQQSSDQWAFYQAKSIREHEYRIQKMVLETQLAAPSGLKPEERAKYEGLATNFEYAEIFLQIAIVTASVAILAESKAMFLFSLTAAILGTLLTANGFTVNFALPFLGHH